MTLTGREKATIFLSILGAENSARVLRYLPDELADLIAAGINHLPTPSPEALNEVMGEFKSYLALPAGEAPPSRIEERPRTTVPKRSYAFLMYERPQLVARLIAMLPEERREEALQNLPREKGLIEELLIGLKTNPLLPKIESALRDRFAEKLFS
jgi:flagellar motor switch protein FliG